jgi:hypothetical protein
VCACTPPARCCRATGEFCVSKRRSRARRARRPGAREREFRLQDDLGRANPQGMTDTRREASAVCPRRRARNGRRASGTMPASDRPRHKGQPGNASEALRVVGDFAATLNGWLRPLPHQSIARPRAREIMVKWANWDFAACDSAAGRSRLKIERAGPGWEPTNPREGGEQRPIYEISPKILSVPLTTKGSVSRSACDSKLAEASPQHH